MADTQRHWLRQSLADPRLRRIPTWNRTFYRRSGSREPRLQRNTKDTVALKYYYQHDPTVAPYAYSSVPGFTQFLDAGAQVASINNTYLVKPNLSTTQTFGFIREKIYANNQQPFTPQSIPGGNAGTAAINTFGSDVFSGRLNRQRTRRCGLQCGGLQPAF